MDLIYTDANKVDVGVLLEHDLDMAIGKENDFELKLSIDKNVCEAGSLIYVEGTEYGGIVDSVAIDTDAETIAYTGRTWHGILNSKILQPDSGSDYLVLSGEANTVLSQLVTRMGVGALFTASSSASGITISNYKMNRYIEGYDGIVKMLSAFGAKLVVRFVQGTVLLEAKPIEDYTQQGEIDSDAMAFKIEKAYHRVNHLLCLGAGELRNRTVIHLYANASGVISQTQTFFGLDEVAEVYDYSSAESTEDLLDSGTKRFRELLDADKLEVDFTDTDDPYDIGDIVGAVENTTKIFVTVPIAKKIVKISNGEINIEYATDDSKLQVLPIS